MLLSPMTMQDNLRGYGIKLSVTGDSHHALGSWRSLWGIIEARVAGCRNARREFPIWDTKNGDNRTVPITPEVYRVFTELWQERRLDTQRVFLYKGMPVRDVKTACGRAAGEQELRIFGCMIFGIPPALI